MYKKRISLWSILVVVIILFSFISLYSQTDDVLDAPVSNTVAKPESVESEEDLHLFEFEDSNKHYTIKIPDDWTKVVQDGYTTFIHSPSATSVQIQTFEYNPMLLTISAQSIGEELSVAGFSLQKFTWNSSTCYTTIYQKEEKNRLYMYAEITYFDQVDAIRLAFIFNGEYTEKALYYLSTISENFQWDSQNPFPAGMIPYYSEYGSYQFIYPENWNTGISENVYYVQDPSTGASISFMATESDVTYENFSQMDYAQYAAQGRSSYILKQFTCDNNIIYAEGKYISGATNMILVQYLISTGSFEYAVTFEIPQNSFSSYSEIVSNTISCFKIYK